MKDLESRNLEFPTVRDFLTELKTEFRSRNNKSAKLNWIEQGSKMIVEFVQEFRRAVRGSDFKEWALVEEFKREININI